MNGTIIRIFPNKGYCFIRGENSITHFALAKEFIPQISFDTAREGQAVSFEAVSDGNKGNGMRAKGVCIRDLDTHSPAGVTRRRDAR